MAIKFKLITRAAVNALKPDARITEHGIVVEKARSGDLVYRIATMVDGQRIHRTIGKASDGTTREDVERALEAIRTQAREGRLDLPKGRKSHPSFSSLAPAYIERLGEIGGKNMKAKRQHVEQLLVPFFGSSRIDQITTGMVEDYVRVRLSTGLKQATVNRELATLSHLLRRMVKWGWMRSDCLPEICKGEEPRKPIVVLSDENAARLMKGAVDDTDTRLWLFVAFGLNTAMRHSEILKVKYADIDFDARRIFISDAKAGEREQPITPSLVTMLRRQRAADGMEATWLFPSQNARAKHPHRMSMAKSFLRAVTAAGLPPSKVTPHVMRHTAITRLVKAGVDLPTIQRISGHKTLPMVLRYVHIHGEHIDTAIAAIDNGFQGLITQDLHKVPKALGPTFSSID